MPEATHTHLEDFQESSESHQASTLDSKRTEDQTLEDQEEAATVKLTTPAQLDQPDQREFQDTMDQTESQEFQDMTDKTLMMLKPKLNNTLDASTAHKDHQDQPVSSSSS